MRGKHSAKAFYIGISFGKEKKTMTNTIRLNVTCFCHNMQSDDTQCYIPIRDIGVCLASCYKDEIWDLRAEFGLIWNHSRALVPTGTKSQIWDLILSIAFTSLPNTYIEFSKPIGNVLPLPPTNFSPPSYPNCSLTTSG